MYKQQKQKQKQKQKLKKTDGFTLLELTVTLSAGIILSCSVIQLYIMVKQMIQTQDEFMHIQEIMQTSTFFMGQAIRSAGNMGCIKWQDARNRSIPDKLTLDHLGLSNNQVIHLVSPASLKRNKLVSPHVLAHMKPNTDILWVVGSAPASDGKRVGDIMVLADCADIALFRWAKSNKWARLEQDNKKLRKFTSILYYISDTNSLSSVDFNRNAQKHVDGVEDWTIRVTPGGVQIQFVFSYLSKRLEWDQQWAVR